MCKQEEAPPGAFFLGVRAGGLAVILCLAAVLAGCAADASQRSPLSAGLSALRQVVWPSAATGVALDTRYRYLRVRLGDQDPAFLVLGYDDAVPTQSRLTWYSALRETVQTERGRVVFTAGLTHNIERRVDGPWPDWPVSGAAPTYTVQEDLAGEAYGIRRTWRLRKVALSSVPQAIQSSYVGDASALQWFVEAPLGDFGAHADDAKAEGAPAIWLALSDRGEWAYTHQCLVPTYCLNLQPWHEPFTH